MLQTVPVAIDWSVGIHLLASVYLVADDLFSPVIYLRVQFLKQLQLHCDFRVVASLKCNQSERLVPFDRMIDAKVIRETDGTNLFDWRQQRPVSFPVLNFIVRMLASDSPFNDLGAVNMWSISRTS